MASLRRLTGLQRLLGVQCTDVETVTPDIARTLHTYKSLGHLLEAGLGINAGAILLTTRQHGRNHILMTGAGFLPQVGIGRGGLEWLAKTSGDVGANQQRKCYIFEPHDQSLIPWCRRAAAVAAL